MKNNENIDDKKNVKALLQDFYKKFNVRIIFLKIYSTCPNLYSRLSRKNQIIFFT